MPSAVHIYLFFNIQLSLHIKQLRLTTMNISFINSFSIVKRQEQFMRVKQITW